MTASKKKPQTYDEYAERWAYLMRNNIELCHPYLEKPAMYGKLLDLKGKTVLAYGCGTGEECEYLLSRGAQKVVGIDASEGLIAYAKKSYPLIEFHVMNGEHLIFKEESFDYVYSSLVMHYFEDWTRALKEVHRVMKKDARFLFSTNHPARRGGEQIRGDNSRMSLLGYEKKFKKQGDTVVITHNRIYGDYLTPRKIEELWFLGELSVEYYHNPLENILRYIRDAQFEVLDFLEPKPLEEVQAIEPHFYETCMRIPMFMIFELKKI